VAKTRRPAKGSKKTVSKKGKPKAVSRAARARRPKKLGAARAASPGKAKPREGIALKDLRKQFGLVLNILSTRVGQSTESEVKLDDTRRRINQMMTDIDEICSADMQEVCGPDMVFPIP
jgi:hypothetical protein